ncbi:hypothetical protein TrVE_jg9637 [Triparma verrucosa]|uniref:Uncharacterized protein n=1 Tax=Triparma verrucosa TaxID=1606542 RepID=A0A9W7FKP8_9STRA|nr:hypothetical protein TrVE_jg9637 [Triparma verrucosa]
MSIDKFVQNCKELYEAYDYTQDQIDEFCVDSYNIKGFVNSFFVGISESWWVVDVLKLTLGFAWGYSRDKKKFQKRFSTEIVCVGDDDEFWLTGAGSAENEKKFKKSETSKKKNVDKARAKAREQITGQSGRSFKDQQVDLERGEIESERQIGNKESRKNRSKARRAVATRETKKEKSTLVDAAERGDANKVGELLAAGADVNYSKEGDEGRTALYKAALNGHLEVVQALVAAKADLNKAKTTGGATPLFVAAQEGHLDVVQELVAAKANADKAKTDGWTPLRVANHFNHTSIVACLKSAGAVE